MSKELNDLFGETIKKFFKSQEQLAYEDALKYGVGFLKVGIDGMVERVSPEEVYSRARFILEKKNDK